MSLLHSSPDTVLEIQRRLPATRERVFRCWADAGQIKRWFGGPAVQVLTVEADVRVGGTYRITFLAPGAEAPGTVTGKYLVVQPPEKLVFTWQIEAADAHTDETTVSVEFYDRGSTTDIVLLHQPLPVPEVRQMHLGGWVACFEAMERLLVLPEQGASPD
jgi:uncharacterized protein YndB with AHSA1/START domain